jgi:hypothetical protein
MSGIYSPYVSWQYVLTHHFLHQSYNFISTTNTTYNQFTYHFIHLSIFNYQSALKHTFLAQHHKHNMDISFDPFTFGATTMALIIAAIELYYTRPRRAHQASASIPSYTVPNLTIS